MNAFIATILRLGIISATDAQALDAATLTPEDAQSLAEAKMQEAFRTGLLAQSERLFKLLGGNNNPTPAQWAAFWEQEDTALLASVQPTILETAQQASVFASVRLADDGWRTVNEAVIKWTNDYYTSATEFGSIPNLNLTSRQEVATAFDAWQRGELAHNLGLPSLALELQPTFGEKRAQTIAITETTRIYSESERQTAIADPDVVYLRWLSAADELVCSICGPLHGRIVGKTENGIAHPGGLYTGFPPAHPRCRCRLVEETAATAKVPLRDNFNPDLPQPNATKQTADKATSAAQPAAPRAVAPVRKTAQDVRSQIADIAQQRDASMLTADVEQRNMFDAANQVRNEITAYHARNPQGGDSPELAELRQREKDYYVKASEIQKRKNAIQQQAVEAARKPLEVDDPASIALKLPQRTNADVGGKWRRGEAGFNKLVSRALVPEGAEVKVDPITGRAYYNPARKSVNLAKEDGERAVIHELGHWLEDSNDAVLQKLLDFYGRRTEGEDLRWLGQGYAKTEKARFDRFIDAYMGKDYRRKGTEILSMGLEYFFADPIKLATDDPDYFDFIFNLLRGQ